jgi:putative ABC transport system substrate-binding protein
MPSNIEAFRQGLRELGYVEGQSISVEYRFAEGKEERYAILAAELVNLGVDVIVTGVPERPSLLSKQPTRFLSSSSTQAISSVRASLPVWRDRVETLRGLRASIRI